MQCNNTATSEQLKSKQDADYLYHIIQTLLSKKDFMQLYNCIDEDDYYTFCDEIHSCSDTQNTERLQDFILGLQEYYIM